MDSSRETDDARIMAKSGSKRQVPVTKPQVPTAKPSYLYRAVFTKGKDQIDPSVIAGPDGEGKGFGYTFALHKTKWSGSPYCLPNELISAEIGRFLRLPIPPCGITTGEGGLVLFSSLDFNFDKLQLPQIVPDLCWAALPVLCTGIVLFDILIANSDRHDENLVVDNMANPTAIRVFDHDQALFGGNSIAVAGIERLKLLTNRLGITAGTVSRGNPHCLLSEVDTDEHFEGWIHRIDAIPDWLISDVCSEARGLGLSKEESTEAKIFLVSRRNTFREIIKLNHKSFTGIANWTSQGLLP